MKNMQTAHVSNEVEIEQTDDKNPSNPEKDFWQEFLKRNNLSSNTVYYRLSSQVKNDFSNTSRLMDSNSAAEVTKDNDSKNPTSLINILRKKHGFLTKGIDPDVYSKDEEDGVPHYWYDYGKEKYYLMGYKNSDYDVVIMSHNISINMITKSHFKDYNKGVLKIISVNPTSNEENISKHVIYFKEIRKGVKDLSSVLMLLGAVSITAFAFYYFEPYLKKGTEKVEKFENEAENIIKREEEKFKKRLGE